MKGAFDMQQIIEKGVFDWSRSPARKVQSRGIVAILEQRAKVIAQSQSGAVSRCVWPSIFENKSSRYLSRRMG